MVCLRLKEILYCVGGMGDISLFRRLVIPNYTIQFLIPKIIRIRVKVRVRSGLG